MNNRGLYQKDPSTWKLVNEGVASVNDDTTQEAFAVLRYELETFVCDGQYEKGVAHILETYLKNIDAAQQPAVWVSGFYGSGKSHLVKMLRALWVDTVLPGKATARGIANLPQSVKDHLKELSTQAKRHGGLHAASGTLGAAASGSVRLALLRIILKSAGLPEQYPLAQFVIWLKHEGIYEKVVAHVEKNGHNWQEELDNLYVAEGLHKALAEAKPNIYPSPANCADTLNNMYPYVQDISSDELVKVIRQILTKDGKFPLTLVVLDEIQQFIGDDSERSMAVQEAVEACCKNIGGKLLFIGTGQTAVTGTANLKKIAGRFTIRVELSDTDVEAVIRKVILAKKPESLSPIEALMQNNLGEISRHLSGTKLGHRQDDVKYFAQDYPILPVRRRFWESTLRVLDQTGTDSQLRNQLSMIHKAIQSNLDRALGNVIPADYLYFDSADKLLQARMLPRKVYDETIKWRKGSADEQLLARACGLVFLVNKLAGSNKEIGIKATVDTIADLLVDDLAAGSSALRSKLPGLMDGCGLLMKVGDEYRIQTEESAAWNDEFLAQRGQLANEPHRIEAERDDRIRAKFGDMAQKLKLNQGKSKVSRELSLVFDAQLPADCSKKICVWVRDGWSIDENSVRADARQAGNQSPTIFVFLPKRSADDLRRHLIDYKAANSTLESRGVPNSPEGSEARAAMETIKHSAETSLSDLLNDSFTGSRVFQGGGSEIAGNQLQDSVLDAAKNALQRLYPQFSVADHEGWEKVYANAKKGAPDALRAVGDTGETAANPVCKAILAVIGAGKKGADIREHFEGIQYGWSKDAIDGGLQALLVAGLVRAQDERGQPIDPKTLERKAIGKAAFKVEATTVTEAQRLQVKKVLMKIGITAKSGQELMSIPEFIQKMNALADSAGGDAPKPARADTKTLLDDIRLASGNEQLIALFNKRDELIKAIEDWTWLGEKIGKRLPAWHRLTQLMQQGTTLQDAEAYRTQVNNIESQRLLLADPDQAEPLISSLTQQLRDELNKLEGQYKQKHEQGMEKLAHDENWKKLEPEQKNTLLEAQKLTAAHHPKISVGTVEEVIKTLNAMPLGSFSDRIAALPTRFSAVQHAAAELMEPQLQYVDLPRRTLRTEADIMNYLKEVEEKLKQSLAKGPVVPR